MAEIHKSGRQTEVRELTLQAIRPGMTLVQDVKSKRGAMILARGQEATPSVLARLRNFAWTTGVQEPIRVILGASEAN